MQFLPENRMCAPPFVTKQCPPIWKILDPPLLMICTRPWRSPSQSHGCQRGWTAEGEGQRWPWPTPCSLRLVTCIEPLFSYMTTETIGSPCTSLNWDLHLYTHLYTLCYGSFTLLVSDMDSEPNGYIVLLPPANVLCEGYVFTPVCQSFCSQGGTCIAGGVRGRGVHGRGVCVHGRGVCVAGVCVLQGGMHGGGVRGRYYEIRSMSGRCILLECILVQNMFTLHKLGLRSPLATSV